MRERRVGFDTIRISSYLMRARSQSPIRNDEAIDEERPQYDRGFFGFFVQSCGPKALCCDASVQIQDWITGFDRFDQVESFAHELRHGRVRMSVGNLHVADIVGEGVQEALLVCDIYTSPLGSGDVSSVRSE